MFKSNRQMEDYGKNEYHLDLGDLTPPIEFKSTYEKGIVSDILEGLKVYYDEDEEIHMTYTPKELTNFIIHIIRTYKIGEFK